MTTYAGKIRQFTCSYRAAACLKAYCTYMPLSVTLGTFSRFEVNVQYRSNTIAIHVYSLCRHFQAEGLLYVPPGLTIKISMFCPHIIFKCFVWISEQTAIIFLYSIN
jgi:hypothetical protein